MDGVCGHVWDRFDFGGQQYVAGILEEDDPGHADRPVVGTPVSHGGRSFTLYLYDREKHHVSVRGGPRGHEVG